MKLGKEASLIRFGPPAYLTFLAAGSGGAACLQGQAGEDNSSRALWPVSKFKLASLRELMILRKRAG